MVGPLSGDEAVRSRNYAKSHPTRRSSSAPPGSQDPTLQIAPKNVFRYYGDGAQWNAGIGEILYKKLGWRKAAIIMDDYSFGWTSAAGIIADFCAIGGQITKRVFPPLQHDGLLAVRPAAAAPGHGRRLLLGRRRDRNRARPQGVRAGLRPIEPKQHAGNLFFCVPRRRQRSSARGSSARTSAGSARPAGSKTAPAKAYEAIVKKWYPEDPGIEDGFVYNYYNAAGRSSGL